MPKFNVLLKRNFVLSFLVLGVGGGLLKGLFAVPLPCLSIFVFVSGMGKDEWRANGLVVQLSALPIKAFYFFVVCSEFKTASISMYAAIFFAGISAHPIGNYLARFLDQKTFVSVVRMLTFVGAVAMGTSGTPITYWASPLATIVCIAIMVGHNCSQRRRRLVILEEEEGCLEDLQGIQYDLVNSSIPAKLEEDGFENEEGS